ncbi:Predicted amidohydrolase [Nakamurella panacisegetis]|uniref:Predicted amidohydrolase n=1 Tax=Nakamurella panacisegetis TaxID=1090615 RepID=A0A1H0R4P8_9ACTN|nr:carbon-nitrogen hydrolase family protein [Nakamurella panacisegetis]SDP24400.1 Predicted amidohydrolase [Nakamurella panacisegetis]
MSPAREPLTIAAVQVVSHPGDIAGTVAEHVRQIADAADAGATVVLFPELSLTGYEPDVIDLHGIRIAPEDPVLQPLSAICRQRRVHALVGAPTASGSLPQIGVLHIDPRGEIRVIYAKQHLDVGEIGIFSAGDARGSLEIGGWKLALAVCYDAAVAGHPIAARRSGADAYLVGALYVIGSESRIDEQMKRATDQGMWAVLAQYSGGTGGGPACGRSGAWRPDGTEVVRLGTGPGIAVVELHE